ncbi:MAG: serine/threonine protein kinase [Polyangiaceae bacterium]|nr:serine/threonine protein kinase [Polyangiaceae bacterium]
MLKNTHTRIILSFCVLMVVGAAISTGLLNRTLSRALAASADRAGETLSSTLAVQLSEPLAYRDRLAVGRQLQNARSANPDVAYVFVTSPDGEVTDHSFTADGFPADLLKVARRTTPTTLLVEEGAVRDLPTPVANGVLGTVHLGVSTRWVEATTWASVTNVVLVTGLAMLLGICGIIVLARLIRTSQLGQYTLEEKIGEGGMGVVYRASHAMLRRPTAVKLLLPDKTSKRILGRFELEVQLTARLTHPNTVTVFDYGRTPQGIFYYAMELIEGPTLQRVVELTGPLPAARAAHILLQVAGALAEAHGVGLIHRDIKPANVMLCERGGVADVAKVLDFGLVKEMATRPHQTLTGIDEIMGTPLFMSPESIQSPGEVGEQADIYSLGALGYYLVTGQHVFQGSTFIAVSNHHLNTTPTPPSQRTDAEVPADLEELILDCLAKSRADRPQTAQAFMARLRTCACTSLWDEAQARRWWREHDDPRLRSPSNEPAVKGQRTLTVDMSQRRPSGGLRSSPPSQAGVEASPASQGGGRLAALSTEKSG